MTLGEKLTALRQRKGFTQQEFCTEINRRFKGFGIKRSTYADWETDNRTPQLLHFKYLVQYHRISADELLFENLIPAPLQGKKITKPVA